MKIALLGTGFGQAHAAVYAQRSDVDEVVVFGRNPQKLAKISDQFGFATTTGSVGTPGEHVHKRSAAGRLLGGDDTPGVGDEDVRLADAPALRDARRLARHLHWRGCRARHARRCNRPRPQRLHRVHPRRERLIELPAISPYAAMIDHVQACMSGGADNLIEPASALTALELTLDVQ